MKLLIIEDEKKQADYLRTLTQKYLPEIETVEIAASVQQSIRQIQSLKPDVVFADIQLTDGLVFDIFDALPDSDFEIIFITAYDEFREKAMNHFAFHYLLKPVFGEDLVRIFKNLLTSNFKINKGQIKTGINFINGKINKIVLTAHNRSDFVNISDIKKCIADGNYTSVVLENGKKYLSAKSLKHYEILLKERGFIRINRSALVNIRHIVSYTRENILVLEGNDNLPVSKRNRPVLQKIIKETG